MPRVHPRPRFCDLVGQNRVFHALLYTACVPFVGQLLAHLNRLQALVDPFAAVAFLEIGFQRTVYRQLRVNRFFHALPTNLCQPELERLGFGRRNGLDDAQKLLGVSNISQTLFAVCCGHFQLVTRCNRFITLILQPFLGDFPIISRRLVIRLVGQYPYHIHDRKEPFFFFSVPCSTDALIFKKLNLIILSHLTSS